MARLGAKVACLSFGVLALWSLGISFVAVPNSAAPPLAPPGLINREVEGKKQATWRSMSASTICCGIALGAAAVLRGHRQQKISRHYSTQTFLPSLSWLKTGFSSKNLGKGDLRTVGLAGCDICVGRTDSGKLFCIGDKAPPTGISFSVGGEIQGEKVLEVQYGNTFDPFTGQPEGEWCPSPPVIGKIVGAFMGERQAVAVFDVREGFFGGDIEVLMDLNAKNAYEADYWKGLLDAQGKDDGSYY